MSAATRLAYASDWRDFVQFCANDNVDPLPATSRTVARYLTHLAGLGRSVSTIDRRAAAIACAHRVKGCDSPTGLEEVRLVQSGIRNALGRAPVRKKALTVDLVVQVVRRIKPDLTGLRDRALILLCFGAALRRSELVALDADDLDFRRKGLLVRIRRAKSDQQGRGATVAVLNGKMKIPAAVQAWTTAAGIAEGPVFRGCDRNRLADARLTAGQFARIVKARCAAAGIDPALVSGHSPRRGFATTCGDEGADLRLTQRQMRHAKLDTTLIYMEDGELFREHAGQSFL